MSTLSPTALPPSGYLAHFHDDGERLAELAERHGLAARIPACPGWTVGDVMTHTAEVYRQQAAVIRLGRRPAAGEWEEAPGGSATVDWFRASLREMYDELGGREPGSAAFTRWPEDPTVCFWYRRMALETVIHRIDVEQACEDLTPVDDALGIDGVDEVLTVFLRDSWAGVPDDPPRDPWPQDGADPTMVVRAGDVEWRCQIGLAGVAVSRTDPNPGGGVDGGVGSAADTSVEGSPEAVLLWLWGRAPDDAVRLDGHANVLRAFRGRLRIATQ